MNILEKLAEHAKERTEEAKRRIPAEEMRSRAEAVYCAELSGKTKPKEKLKKIGEMFIVFRLLLMEMNFCRILMLLSLNNSDLIIKNMKLV